jgi:glycosyltransferase 2 family protein
VFSVSRGARRFRRATDVIVLVPALVLVGGLIVAYPPSRLERSLAAFLDSVPGWLDPVWGFAYDLFALWAIAVVLLAVVARRVAVVVSAGCSIVAAGVLLLVSSRIAVGRWPDTDDLLLLQANDSTFPLARVVLCAAVILAVGPHLVRPLERAGDWILFAGIVGAMLTEPPTPSATLAAFAIGVVAAAAIRLGFGTSAGHPETADVLAALTELGVEVDTLHAAARQPAGAYLARGTDVGGRPLLVKVYGRDAYDTHLLERLWRTVLYRDEGQRLRLSRIEAVEHEALLTLLAGQAGVPTSGVVTAAESSPGDAFLVLLDDSRPLAELAPERVDDGLLRQAWRALALLGAAGIAHLRIDERSLVMFGEDVGLVDFGSATLAPRADQLLTDRAQFLATTAGSAGVDRAVGIALEALGRDGLAELTPYLQPAVFPPRLRRALDAAGIEVDDLRLHAAEAAGVEAPQLVKLRRVTWWTLAQAALLVFATATVLDAFAGLELDELGSTLEDASWAWVVFALLFAQLPRVTQAISTLGAITARLPFVPVYAMQLASGYMNLALPSGLARMAINIRFFQRQGVPPAAAITGGAIDSFASTVVQGALLGLLLLFSESSIDLHFERPSEESLRLALVLAALALVAVLGLTLVRRVRVAIVDRTRRWWPEVRAALSGLRATHKLALLLGGSLATELLFATALGMFAEALGYDVSIADLLLINISVSLLASLIPIPGGIGVAELGLTVGLAAIGLPDEAALATALLYRVATFYLPPVWGFFALRWLRSKDFL